MLFILIVNFKSYCLFHYSKHSRTRGYLSQYISHHHREGSLSFYYPNFINCRDCSEYMEILAKLTFIVNINCR